MKLLILLLFIVWYIIIVFEHHLEMDKAKASLFFWTLAWIIIFINIHYLWLDLIHTEEKLNEIILEVAELSLFLMSAMTIIAYLSERKVLTSLAHKIIPQKISKVKLLFILWIFTFLFSSIADNLTATLVSITILLSIKEIKENIDDILIFAAFIIFAANAWGVWLITWDITTLMIFLAWKVKIIDLLYLFIPSFLWFMTLYFLFISKLKWKIEIIKSDFKLQSIDIRIFITFLLTIVAIILGHVFYHIPPMIIFLFWLSIIFLMWWHHKRMNKEDLWMIHFVHKVEFNAIFFFLWILLMVWALDYFHLLSKISILYEIMPYYLATFLIWILSSVVDNIPLTAAMLKAWLPITEAWWLNMTYAVWVWWSLLLIWSAAWVIAMAKCKSLTFGLYLKYLPHIFIAYTVWYIGTIAISRFI